jgi:regulator of sigma E protease
MLVKITMLFLSLTILVTLHELGHYLPARWFDTKVRKFYLFFDFFFPFSNALPYSLVRVLYDQEANKVEFFKNKAAVTVYRTGHSKTDTEYGLGYFPMGGYVQIAGMVDETQDANDLPEEPQPWEFRSKKAWQRLIIMVGGVTVNFVLGVLIFSMLLFIYGKEYIPVKNVQNGVYADSIAQYVGFKTGDNIISVGGKPFEKFNSRSIIRDIVINNATSAEIVRDGKTQTIQFNEGSIAALSNQKVKGIDFVVPRVPFVIDSVVAWKNGEKAGLKKNDQILALDDKPITYYDEYIMAMKNRINQPVNLKVLRNNDTLNIAATTDEVGKLWLGNRGLKSFFKTEKENFTFLQSFPAGLSDGIGFLGDQFKAFGQMFKSKIKASDSMGGIGSMAGMFPDHWDWEAFWRITGILSFVLAVMNLLPIPGLDGGYVIFLLWEIISGKKPSDKFVEKATTIGFFLLLALMIYANGLDVFRSWFGK